MIPSHIRNYSVSGYLDSFKSKSLLSDWPEMFDREERPKKARQKQIRHGCGCNYDDRGFLRIEKAVSLFNASSIHKKCNYVNRAAQTGLSLTKFIISNISIYVFK